MTSMAASRNETPALDRDEAFRAIADRRRRALLRVLDGRQRITPAELARCVVAEETDTPRRDVARREVEEARLTLEHVHLPRLTDVGLVSLGEDIVTIAQHPALQDQQFREMIDTDAQGWDEVLGCFADERRRVVLSTLSLNDGPMDRADLAAEVAETAEADAQDSVHDVLVELHHVHLPKLDEAGLLTYDVEDHTVTFEGHPALDEEWLAAGADDRPPTIVSAAD